MERLRIRDGCPGDAPRLAEIARSAMTLFAEVGLHLPPDDPEAELVEARWVLVAELPGARPDPVGFVQLVELDAHAHLQEISVHPRYGRRGVGSALVDAACGAARGRGYRWITLTTFAEVAFNGPWYARLGFQELDRGRWGPQLTAQWDAEMAAGIGVAPRIAMLRDLAAA
ncbi:GNAT family N-acetyltransferase [Lipingzhangella sp. LS1_29]|uniref:GNAT family N-acetyltransferase n=1 Tax=Lipingzhangella rawalii TaxID=2055835 RepID=A0ABU2H9I9_9ACTN|nr:GNAT family N-acetyltransferase [Lipingzhangella rawalii]MDS1271682.1 GNAT family N-acetyltransferase [Lipingzhangella rawalii]